MAEASLNLEVHFKGTLFKEWLSLSGEMGTMGKEEQNSSVHP